MCLSLIVRRQLVLHNKDERIAVVTKLVGFQEFRVDGKIECFIRLCGASNSGRLIWNNRKANAMADRCRPAPPSFHSNRSQLSNLVGNQCCAIPMFRHGRSLVLVIYVLYLLPLPFPANPSLRKV